jgi:peptidoglycan hydrolase-like protein with peptidoglycan-binding domain
MNIKNLKNLINDLGRNVLDYKSNHPSKFKYIVISFSGAAILTITIITVSTSSLFLKDTAASPGSESIQVTASSTGVRSQKSTTVSRGATSLDPTKGDIIKLGVKNSIVITIQKKLMELDYIEVDEPTEEFGETLKTAVELFQRKNNLKITGEVDSETYSLLISGNAKAYTVYIGAEGTDVEQLQNRLYELGYLSSVTSYFGTDTDAAVKEFQKRNGLYDDGNVGSQTREVLYSSEAIPLSFYLGDENDEIMKYQQKLYQLGYLTSKPDGKYGNDTVAAVKSLQDKNGLIADGYIGPATKELLMSGDVSENAIIIGDSGKDVTNVQTYLKKLGYLNGVTGYFGSDTNNAVINFQKRNGLTADGKVGSQTISKLLSSDAKKWTGNSSSGSSSSSSHSSGHSSGSSSNSDSYDNSSGPNASLFVSIAMSKIGSRYVYGAKGPSTFDCSGFVYWVLNQAGIRQGYMTSYGWNSTGRYQKITSMSSIRRGDIISYNGHVGIALGNNQMIDASSSQGQVRITNITSSYWTRNFVCAYRVF